LIFNTASTLYRAQPDSTWTALPDPEYLRAYSTYHPRGNLERSLDEGTPSEVAPELGLDTLLLQRREIVDSKIRMVLSDIYQRRFIKDDNLYRINLDQCSFRNLVFYLGEHCWDKSRMELERRIIDLEEEKRAEEKSYFKDLLFLKKELRESLIEHMEEEQKAKMLSDQVEGYA
jgi:hypothetical protein